jgi:polar amino acid transport system substrate-binding protein
MPLFRKVVIVLYFCTFAFLSASTASQTIYINNLEWPPFFFTQPSNEQLGFGKEILNICLNQNSYLYQYKTLPIKRTHIYMQTGELDVSIYSYKKERNAYMLFAEEPIFTSVYGIASKKSSNLKIEKFDDINNYTIGHLSGLAHTPELLDIIAKKAQKNELSIGLNLDAMFKQMLAIPQRFEVMPNSKETFLWRAKQLGISDKITVHDIVFAKKDYFVTVSKLSKNIAQPRKLLNNIDSCIRELKLNGTYRVTSEQYGI